MSAMRAVVRRRALSPATRAAVEILTAKGFVVTWRVNRNDDIRLRVNGSREMSPLQVTTKFGRFL
jgi:hypothetical protein